MIDLNEMLAGCINFLMAWFLLGVTGVVAIVPVFFLLALWVDSAFRAKWKARVLAAYALISPTVTKFLRKLLTGPSSLS